MPLVVLAAILVALSAPLPSHALSPAQPPRDHLGAVAMAFDGQGGMLLAWERFEAADLTTTVLVAERRADGSWTPTGALARLPADRQIATGQLDVAMNAAGAAAVVWRRPGPAGAVLQAATRVGRGGFGSAADLSAAGANAYFPQVVIDARGDAVAVWVSHDGEQAAVMAAATYGPGAGWSAPQALSAPGWVGSEPALAMGPDGNTLAAWAAGTATYETVVQMAERSQGSVFSPTVSLSSPLTVVGQSPQVPAVALGPNGAAVVAWHGPAQDDNRVVQIAERAAAGAWRTRTISASEVLPPEPSQHPRREPHAPLVAIDAQGGAVAVWERRTTHGEIAALEAAARTPTGEWSEPQVLVPPVGRGLPSHLAVSPSGTAVALWWKDGLLRAAVRPPGAPFGSLETVAAGPAPLALTFGADGGAIVYGTRLSGDDPRAPLVAWSRGPSGAWGREQTVYLLDRPAAAVAPAPAAPVREGASAPPPAVLSELRALPARIVSGAGTVLSFRLSAGAAVRLVLQRRGGGPAVRELTVRGRAGTNRVPFAGLRAGRPPRAGAYVLRALAGGGRTGPAIPLLIVRGD
jgi:hypothetical protein